MGGSNIADLKKAEPGNEGKITVFSFFLTEDLKLLVCVCMVLGH
jgi:hypothetical protein